MKDITGGAGCQRLEGGARGGGCGRCRARRRGNKHSPLNYDNHFRSPSANPGSIFIPSEQPVPPLPGRVLDLDLLPHEQIQENQPEVSLIKLSSSPELLPGLTAAPYGVQYELMSVHRRGWRGPFFHGPLQKALFLSLFHRPAPVRKDKPERENNRSAPGKILPGGRGVNGL